MAIQLAEALAFLSPRKEHKVRRAKYAPITGHISNDRDRRIVECLCEQQVVHMKNLKVQALEEATLASDVAIFNKYALKMIPRVYPSLFVKDLISIQPIPLPNAKVFYKDFLRDPNGTRLDLKQYFDRTYGNRPVELSAVAKIKMQITSADIVATAKALEYQFSAELDQDLTAYHGTSADPELGAEAAQEMQREIEYDIINTLITEAGAGNVNWLQTPPTADNTQVNIDAYNKTLFAAICDARNLVFKQRYTYPNWLICSPDFAVRLEKLQGFEYDPLFSPGTLLQGRQFFGTVRNIISIYVDPWFPVNNQAVLGYKGITEFDVGCCLSPYVPFYSTALFENPNDLSKSRSILSRQAITMLVPEMFSTLTIADAS